MTTRMLIDARHREETRVAVVKGNRIEEFDFESAEHKQLKGNIYLAKVTRVEPSLQAAFVEFGGNRHGFLAFSEIHPDYYQIPKEDREALLREEAEYAAAQAALRDEELIEDLEGEVEDIAPPAPLDDHHDDRHDDDDHDDDRDDNDDDDADGELTDEAGDDRDAPSRDGEQEDGEEGDNPRADDNRGGRTRRRRGRGRGRDGNGDRGDRKDRTAALDADRDPSIDKRPSLRRRYKIQDVIKRRQVMLVQVVKEERGNKGAALTTYLSLAGRYCVLMPNTSHGGGISRKISNGADRRRLKTIIDDLDLPQSMGCIVRTAGLSRTKPEIKRDFDYLARLWDEIRDRTLKSAAPALVHSDSDLIKRAIRDIYHRDIDDVMVEGEDGYRAAKDFMKLLMPSHAKRVQQYADPVPLFQRFGVEDQLGAMYQPVVPLKSGGYLVINPTEALVSIDINSGRSTREYNIEQTALNTNLEAAYEIARQLRLRDMAGLVVIDFIDMEVGSHVRKVERAMKDALKNDRARIQVGRISGFGLMEMSRQRLRTGVLEASTRSCPHCEGTGLVRTASSAGLSALRLLEEEGARGRGSRLTLRASQEAAFYVLNNKRAELTEIEDRYGVTIDVQSDGQTEGARMLVEPSGPPPVHVPRAQPIIHRDDDDDDFAFDDEDMDDAEADDTRDDDRDGDRPARQDAEGDDGERKRKRRRRRRRRGRRDGDDAAGTEQEAHDRQHDDDDESSDAADQLSDDGQRADPSTDDTDSDTAKPRRGRGRGRSKAADSGDGPAIDAPAAPSDEAGDEVAANPDADASDPTAEPAAPKGRRRRKAGDASDAVNDADNTPKLRSSRSRKAAPAAVTDEATDEPAAPKGRRRTRKDAESAPVAEMTAEKLPSASITADNAASTNAADATQAESDGDSASDGEPRKRGWWQRTFG